MILSKATQPGYGAYPLEREQPLESLPQLCCGNGPSPLYDEGAVMPLLHRRPTARSAAYFGTTGERHTGGDLCRRARSHDRLPA